MAEQVFVGRKGAAQILDTSESQTRNLEAAGLLQAVMVVEGRKLYSAAAVRELRARRDAERLSRGRHAA